MTTPSETNVKQVVDHLFRHQAGQMVSTLTRVFGASYFDLAETVVQEALIKAMQVWPFQGVPDNPGGWIVQVARNQALDAIRRDRFLSDREEEIENSMDRLAEQSGDVAGAIDRHFDPLLRDDQLRMIFICCHPILSREARVALTLKTLCGFGAAEVARAFLVQCETIEQRLVRAKRAIKEAGMPFEVPEPRELADRLDSVSEVLYLLFNEGYGATQGDLLIRRDLCDEAIRLGSLVVDHPLGRVPKLYALLALMHFQASRFAARLDARGDVLLLEEQDRSAWDRAMIKRGLDLLHRSAQGNELTDYHLQASIAACHATAPSFAETNWTQILSDYEELLQRSPTPVVALNRAVALMMVEGPETAIREVEKMASLPAMERYYLLPATLAEMCYRAGRLDGAREYYARALRLVGTEPERRFLLKRLERLVTKPPRSLPHAPLTS